MNKTNVTGAERTAPTPDAVGRTSALTRKKRVEKAGLVLAAAAIGIGTAAMSECLGPCAIPVEIAATVAIGAIALRAVGAVEKKRLHTACVRAKRKPVVARAIALACDGSASAWRSFGGVLLRAIAKRALTEVTGLTLLAVAPPVAICGKVLSAANAGWESGAFVHELATA